MCILEALDSIQQIVQRARSAKIRLSSHGRVACKGVRRNIWLEDYKRMKGETAKRRCTESIVSINSGCTVY